VGEEKLCGGNRVKIHYLGAGAWGFTLASLLAKKGYEVICWTQNEDLAKHLNSGNDHPKFPGYSAPENLRFTTDLAQVVKDPDLLVEGVTSAGLRPMMEQIKEQGIPNCPIVLTSKGIEQNTGLFLTQVVSEVLGKEHRPKVGCLSGPTIAIEVLRGAPASIVCSGYDSAVISKILEAFTTPTLRVYPNPDIHGIELGGAMKNIIAIACGASDGLGYGENAKAALMTRGLHEIRRLAIKKGCLPETINGLAGMGDLCVTCLSKHSRNYQFGNLIAQGMSVDEAKEKIGMVVEGAYTCLSAVQLAKKLQIELPISEAVYQVLYKGLPPKQVVTMLLQRAIKKEYL
jgi:glycerol-3-phosphate dehydrogenase (NAD(P)+)